VGSEKIYRDSFGPMMKRLSFLPNPPLAAKDTLDLYRSGSMIGQTIFSFILPLAVIWFFLSLLGPFFPPHGLLMIFAITTGVIASTMYTWVTMFDAFGPYACLPVAVSTLIESKLTTFAILQFIPAAFIAAVATLTGGGAVLVPAVVLGLSVSFYAVAVMAWLSGLSPSVLVYDVKVLALYLVLVGIALTLFTAAAFANPYFALGAVVLLVPAWLFVQKAEVRWDAVDPSGF
jgi:MFS family permease